MAGTASSLFEIVGAVEDLLPRFGLAGALRVDRNDLVLEGYGPVAVVPLGALPEQWASLPHSQRDRRANQLARDLASARRAAASDHPAGPAAPGRRSPVVAVAAVVLLAVLSVVGYVATRGAPVASKTPTLAASIEAYEVERSVRAQRVCDATRSRVMRGASVGPTDVEGWVAELSLFVPVELARPEITRALAPYLAPVAPDVVRPTAELTPSLADIEGPTAVVSVSMQALPEPGVPRWRRLDVTFSGRYVTPFFEEAGRVEFMRLASTSARVLGAHLGALYARCAGGSQHHLGAWFHGSSPGAAAGSLLYFMGAFADSPHLRASFLAPEGHPARLDPTYALEAIQSAAKPLDKQRVATLIGRHGGMIAVTDERAAVTFPFRDANRASRASRDLAASLGIGLAR